MVVASSVVLTPLIAVSVIHQISLQSLHLLLPVVVSQCVAAKPPVYSCRIMLIVRTDLISPDEHMVGRSSVEIHGPIVERLWRNLSNMSG